MSVRSNHNSEVTSLADFFVRSLSEFPQRPAIWADEKCLSYEQLAVDVFRIKEQLTALDTAQCVGLIAHRTHVAYAAVLGILASGRTYVALNPKFPTERNRKIAASAGLEHVIVDANFADHELSTAFSDQMVLLNPAVSSDNHSDSMGQLEIVAPKTEDQHAYVMFTSGTTGEPKGVPITHRNVITYVDNIRHLTDLYETDRFSQTFDLTFDLSVHDMFVAWSVGACLYVLPERVVMAPAKFIKTHELSVWFSVPSTIGFMQKLRTLKAGHFPSLRCSWFCGEALPAESARLWQLAAPNSFVENLYGPTEATIAFTAYRWMGSENDQALAGGYVPIGVPMGDLEAVIIDPSDRRLIAAGESGELCLGGAQLSPGYWRAPDKSADAFFEKAFAGKRCTRWYCTGDVARENSDGAIEFIGRVDNQIKILGYRAELGEIERVVRQVCNTEIATAVPWPVQGATAHGVIVFVSECRVEHQAAIDKCAKILPRYMVPSSIRELDNFPMNANGKIDRNELKNILQRGE